MEKILDQLNNQPTLNVAVAIAEKCVDLGFAWDNLADTIAAIDSEIAEVREEFQKQPINFEKVFDELGDVVFTISIVAAFIRKNHSEAKGFNLDSFAQKTLKKFTRRFTEMKKILKVQGLKTDDETLKSMPYSEWKKLWVEAKLQISGLRGATPDKR